MAKYSLLPRDAILCILTRLPVKLLARFKSVCKDWCELIATPEFMKMHIDQFSNDPENVIFHYEPIAKLSIDLTRFNPLFLTRSPRTMSLLSIESKEKKPAICFHPCLGFLHELEIVGCCNGLVCMVSSHLGEGFVLWNPALRLFKIVRFPNQDLELSFDDELNCNLLRVGVGYDAEEGDFKVVVLVCSKEMIGLKNIGIEVVNNVVVYSANSDSWKIIKLDFELELLRNKGGIVNGNPYWEAMVDRDRRALVFFDVRKLVFKIVPLDRNWKTGVRFIDWKGCVGALVYVYNSKASIENVDLWVLYDLEEKIWRKNHSFGPIDEKARWFVLCTKNGKVIIEHPNPILLRPHPKHSTCDLEESNPNLLVFDVEEIVFDEECVEEIVFDEVPIIYFGIYRYSESMAYVKGMKPFVEEEDYHQHGHSSTKKKKKPAWSIND